VCGKPSLKRGENEKGMMDDRDIWFISRRDSKECVWMFGCGHMSKKDSVLL
jgi:hypothetical protein